MALKSVPFDIPPGVVKRTSLLDGGNRFVDCDKIRWVRGRAQKIGGWTKITDTALVGTVRGMFGWSDGTAKQIVAAGTENKLYAVPLIDYTPVDITPNISTSTITDPLTTTNGSASITVTYTSHNAAAGQYANFTGASAVNGVTIDGSYAIQSVTDGDHFVISAGTAATGSGSGGGDVTIGIEIPAGVASPTYRYGWGVGAWGSGTWGTARSSSSYLEANRQWYFDSFGKLLLANYSGSPLYVWDPTATSAARASKVTDSPYYPTAMTGFLVTPERIVIAWGTDSESAGTQDLLEVWTSRQGDYTDWDYTGLPNDQGAQPTVSRLAVGKKVVAGANIGGYVTLLWTDAALYLKQYTGSQLVFSTRLVGTDCGLLGPMAFSVHNGVAYWMSESAFFMYAGGLQKVPKSDDIAEWVFSQLRDNYNAKAFSRVNPRYSEVWFWIVPAGETEPAVYAVYNYEGQFWFHGTMDRTSIARIAGDSSPIMAAADGYLYEHEVGVNDDAGSMPWSLSAGPFELENGAAWVECMGMRMDMQRQTGDMTISFTAYDGVSAAEATLQTDTVTAARTDTKVFPRFSGRQVAVAFSGTGVDCDVRFGVPRFEIKTGARR